MVDNCLIAVFETKKEPAFLQVLVELMTRFELVTSSLPIAIIAHGVLKLCLSWFEDLSLGHSNFAEIQTRHHPIQPFAPEAVEPFAFPEAFHQMRADCVIAADERATEHMLFQDFISESPQRQHLGRVVGAVDAGRDIAALTTACAGIGCRS